MKGWRDSANLVRCWVSPAVTEASITSGTSQSITIPGFPAKVVPLGCYLIADEAATSGNANTTTLTYALGVSGATGGYLASGVNVLTLTGPQSNGAGILVGCYRAADTLLLTITAGGGAPNVSHITNLQVRAVVYYVAPTTV